MLYKKVFYFLLFVCVCDFAFFFFFSFCFRCGSKEILTSIVELQNKHGARVRELEFDNQKLQQALNEYRAEHSSLQDQAVTVAKLRERGELFLKISIVNMFYIIIKFCVLFDYTRLICILYQHEKKKFFLYVAC
jgi:hypothetical protein